MVSFCDSERSLRSFVLSRTNSSIFSEGTPTILTGPVISRPAATPPGADTVWSAPPGPANKSKAKIEPHSAAREGIPYRDMLLKRGKPIFLMALAADRSGSALYYRGLRQHRPAPKPFAPQNSAALVGA